MNAMKIMKSAMKERLENWEIRKMNKERNKKNQVYSQHSGSEM